ncbi:MAG: hypothetical protein IJ658_01920, partial [Kiritimatiellae bacterium]|nr:hypothetical protein [Kiritimatiellia bacterium]
MKNNAMTACVAAVAACAVLTANAETRSWKAQSGNWSDTACWADGALPEDGDGVALAGTGGIINLEGGATAALAAISNTISNSGWTITNGTVNLSDGMVAVQNTGNLKMSAQLASPSTTTLVKRGSGSLFLYATNTALRCSFVLEGGRVLPVDDLSFGVVPETLRADAITLRGGALFNAEAGNRVTIAPTRGITVDGIGYFAGRFPDALVVASPVTGSGDVCIVQQSGGVRFDAANTYTGETVLGDAQHPFKWGTVADFTAGADGALPATTRLRSAVNGAT